ncbi:hypothetical protein LEP1GSC012_1620, partial [Leptospira interrogans serovar Valbuzzi str. Valbuzzi]
LGDEFFLYFLQFSKFNWVNPGFVRVPTSIFFTKKLI